MLSNLYETWWKYSSQEYFMLLEYQLDWIKIVDFSLIAKFMPCVLFFCSPSMYRKQKKSKIACSHPTYLALFKAPWPRPSTDMIIFDNFVFHFCRLRIQHGKGSLSAKSIQAKTEKLAKTREEKLKPAKSTSQFCICSVSRNLVLALHYHNFSVIKFGLYLHFTRSFWTYIGFC